MILWFGVISINGCPPTWVFIACWDFEAASCPTHQNEIKKTTLYFNKSPQHVVNTMLKRNPFGETAGNLSCMKLKLLSLWKKIHDLSLASIGQLGRTLTVGDYSQRTNRQLSARSAVPGALPLLFYQDIPWLFLFFWNKKSSHFYESFFCYNLTNLNSD